MQENAAIEMLSKEHKLILQVVLGLHGLGRILRDGGTIEFGLLREAVAFMQEFADRCHHAKEEEILFPALVEHGVPLHGCPLDALLREHHEGRNLVKRLSDAVDRLEAGKEDATTEVVATIDAIERLYPDHIWKEDEMVFPMAGRLIPEEVRRRLIIQFEEVETRNPSDAHERFHNCAYRLSAAVAAGS